MTRLTNIFVAAVAGASGAALADSNTPTCQLLHGDTSGSSKVVSPSATPRLLREQIRLSLELQGEAGKIDWDKAFLATSWASFAQYVGTQDFSFETALYGLYGRAGRRPQTFVRIDFGLGDNDFGSVHQADKAPALVRVDDGDWTVLDTNMNEGELACLSRVFDGDWEAPAADVSTCVEDGDCEPSQYCYEQTACVEKNPAVVESAGVVKCEDDGDCKPSQYCRGEQILLYCVEKNPAVVELAGVVKCMNDSDCKPSQYCYEQILLYCVEKSPAVVELADVSTCVEDGDCEPSQICYEETACIDMLKQQAQTLLRGAPVVLS